MNVIAIDGPAGSGKSTIARTLATRIGVPYLDTGAMYRGLTVGLIDRDIDLSDEHAVSETVPEIALEWEGGHTQVDGVDVSERIRSTEVTTNVSTVAANPRVRDVLVARQREWVARHGGGVLEGRDIGTVVFPDATLKIYLTASPIVRAQRRAGEIENADVEAIAADIARRDAADSARRVSPLATAKDAITLDTSDMNIDEVVEAIADMVP